MRLDIKVGDIWRCRDGILVKVHYISNVSNWYPIYVHRLDTKEIYSVHTDGYFEAYYDHEPSPEDIVKLISRDYKNNPISLKVNLELNKLAINILNKHDIKLVG